MKTYRVSMLDFSKSKGKVVYTKYITGLSNVRAAIPEKLHYSRNAKGFVAYIGNIEYWAFQV